MNTDDHGLGVLKEDYDDKLDRILDIVASTNERVTRMEGDIAEMKPNVELIPAINSAVTDQTRDINRIGHQVGDHEHRLQSIEHAA